MTDLSPAFDTILADDSLSAMDKALAMFKARFQASFEVDVKQVWSKRARVCVQDYEGLDQEAVYVVTLTHYGRKGCCMRYPLDARTAAPIQETYSI